MQLKATLKGTVKCLPATDCSQASVTLKVLDGITVKSVQAKGTYFLMIFYAFILYSDFKAATANAFNWKL